MNPLEYIKEGIQKNDMSIVADGYNKMTGEELVVKENAHECKCTNYISFYNAVTEIVDSFTNKKTIQQKTEKEDSPKKPKRKYTRKVKQEGQKLAKVFSTLPEVSDRTEVESSAPVLKTALRDINMQFVSDEYSPEEHEISLKIGEMSSGNRRPAYKTKMCGVCGKNEGIDIASDEETKVLCNDCLLKRKSK